MKYGDKVKCYDGRIGSFVGYHSYSGGKNSFAEVRWDLGGVGVVHIDDLTEAAQAEVEALKKKIEQMKNFEPTFVFLCKASIETKSIFLIMVGRKTSAVLDLQDNYVSTVDTDTLGSNYKVVRKVNASELYKITALTYNQG